MEYAIETENLTKTYGKNRAVNRVSLHVPKGKIYGLIGKNGAGKTTLIRMIMGLIKSNEGNIYVFKKNGRKERREIIKNIGAIIETPGFYENLSAYENLKLLQKCFRSLIKGFKRY